MSLISFRFPNLPPLFNETPPTSLAVTHTLTSICNKSDAKKNDVTQSNVQETANVFENKSEECHVTAALRVKFFCPLICCRMKHISVAFICVLCQNSEFCNRMTQFVSTNDSQAYNFTRNCHSCL